MEERKVKEAAFHNRREVLKHTDPAAYAEITKNKKYYSITEKSAKFLEDWYKTKSPEKKLLDYCCGPGISAIRAARYGANVTGIDISAESIQTATQNSKTEGLADRCNFQVMDAENLTFPDSQFDLITCLGVLHHLDVNRAFPELARVLRPGGEVFCMEALGYNPLINWYRRRTPQMRTEWEVDHILTLKEVDIARQYFDGVKVYYFHLAALAAVPFRNLPGFRAILGALNGIDNVLLKVPGIQKQAWQMVFVLSKPRKQASRASAGRQDSVLISG